MAMNQRTRTVEEIVLPWAEKMKPCCGCRNCMPIQFYDPPGKCNGTGQVAEFPMLREPCELGCENGKIAGCIGGCRGGFPLSTVGRACALHQAELEALDCPDCQGRGWLPVTTTDALLEAIRQMGLTVVIWGDAAYEVGLYRVDNLDAMATEIKRPFKGEGPTLQIALALALEAVKKGAANAT